MINSILIDGKKLAGVIAESEMQQTELAKRIGVTPPTISRWKTPGSNYVKRESLHNLAITYGMTIEDLLERIGVDKLVVDTRPAPGLSDVEQAILQSYRALSPHDKAKAFLQFEEMVNQLDD